MLSLSRKRKQSIVMTTKDGEIIVVHFADSCRIAVDAPKSVQIMRGELCKEDLNDGEEREAG